MLTEDVDITWKLQRDHWHIRFEQNAKCWILMPETLKGLWKQRLRWAQGGAEVFLRNIDILADWRQFRMWPLLLDLFVSMVWVYLVAIVGSIAIASSLHGIIYSIPATPMGLPRFGDYVGMLVYTSLVQFVIGFYLDSRYEKGLWKSIFSMIWYPFAYWLIVASTTFVGLPKALLKKRGQRAVWVSPDRGVRQSLDMK